jgi:hypothetical protein
MFYKFPIDFVYWEQVGNHKKIKEKLLPAILNKKRETINPPSGWECNVNTSFNMGSEFNNFLVDDEIISEVIWKPLDNMFEQLDHSVALMNIKRFTVTFQVNFIEMELNTIHLIQQSIC